MNANTSTELAAVAAPAQPQISSTYNLLASSVLYAGVRGALLIDLYGTHDADGYEVCAVALAGTTIDLDDVLGQNICDTMTAWCERHLPSGAELRAASRFEARIERHEWDREMRIGIAA